MKAKPGRRGASAADQGVRPTASFRQCEHGTQRAARAKMVFNVAVKVQVPKKARRVHFLMRPVGKILLLTVTISVTIGLCVFTYYYVKYSRLIEAKLAAGPFANTSMLFAAPRTVAVGDVVSPQEIAIELRHSGYNESSKTGWVISR